MRQQRRRGGHDIRRPAPTTRGVEPLEPRRMLAGDLLPGPLVVDPAAPPDGVIAADVNGDRVPDLVTFGGATRTVGVAINLGAGRFGPFADYPAGGSPTQVVAGDFDGDGNADLAVVEGGSVVLIRGLGTSLAAPSAPVAGVTNATAVAVGDVNGDGRPDLAVAEAVGGRTGTAGVVAVLLGAGGFAFGSPATYAVAANPQAIAAADLNGDGKADLVELSKRRDASTTPTVSVLLNVGPASGTGAGTFGGATSVGVGQPFQQFAAVAVADLNGDGRPDVVVGGGQAQLVGVLLNNGAGRLTPSTTGNLTDANGSTAVAAVDLDGTGRPDVVEVVGDGSIYLAGNRGDGTFAVDPNGFLATATLQTGRYPATSAQAVAVADFDGDGEPDLAVATAASDANGNVVAGGSGVELLRTGQDRAAFPAGPQPQAGAAADLNGDGLADLVVANDAAAGTVSVLLNAGGGAASPAVAYAVGANPVAVAVADVNGDGKADLVAVNSGGAGTVSVLLGTGAGTFGAAATYTAGASPTGLTVADFNGDGRPDLAVADAVGGGAVTVLLNAGAGTFPARLNTPTGYATAGVVAADLNRDGRADLAVADANGVTVAFGSGNGQFTGLTHVAIAGGTTAVAAADFTADGRPDLAAAEGAVNAVAVLPQSSTGTFAASGAYAVGGSPVSLAAADFSGDGLPDLAVANAAGSTVSVLTNTGGGSFARAVAVPAGAFPQAVVAADFNGDGRPDLAAANPGGTATVAYDTDGYRLFDALFPPQSDTVRQYDLAGYADAALADLNGDGKLDLVLVDAGQNRVTVALGLGNGSFAGAAAYAAGTDPEAVAVADVTGDGYPDLVVAAAGRAADAAAGTPAVSAAVSVLANNSLGAFAAATTVFTAGGPSDVDVAAGDVNGDGKVDLAVTTRATNTLTVLRNRGGTAFTAVALTTGSGPASVAVADLNADGYADVAVADAGANAVAVYRGSASLAFAAPTAYPAGNGPVGLVAADVTGDGRPDLVAVDPADAALSVLVNTGAAFAAAATVPAGGTPSSVAVADVNGDGVADLVAGDADAQAVAVLLGQGGGTFAAPAVYAAPTPNVPTDGLVQPNPSVVLAGDLDGDGRPDVVSVNANAGQPYVLPGRPTVAAAVTNGVMVVDDSLGGGRAISVSTVGTNVVVTAGAGQGGPYVFAASAVTSVLLRGGTAVADAVAVSGLGATPLTIASGLVSLTNDPAGTATPVTVAAGGTLAVPAGTAGAVNVRRFAALTVAAGGNVVLATPTTRANRTLLVVASLALDPAGRVDAGGNDLDLPGAVPATVAALVRSGQSTGLGLVSSAAAANARHTTALGVIVNGQLGTGQFSASRLFDGTAPAGTDVLVKYTYLGDANLDGTVNGADYTRVDAGYAAAKTTSPLTGWANGDFNYDGTVDGSDYTLVDNAFDLQTTALPTAQVATPTAQVAAVSPAVAGRVPTTAIAPAFVTSARPATVATPAPPWTTATHEDLLDRLGRRA